MTFINILLLIIFGALLVMVAVPVFIVRLIRGNLRGRHDFWRSRNKEGEVSVSGKDASAEDKIIGDNVGEYVEYEEVEDKK